MLQGARIVEEVGKLKYEAPKILVEFDLTVSGGSGPVTGGANGFDEFLTDQILTDDLLGLP